MRPDLVLYRIVRGIFWLFCKGFWRLSVEGAEHLPATGAFVLAPIHRSNIDTPLVACITTRRMRFMGKESMWKFKTPGRLFSALGAFPVNREVVDRDALRKAIEVVEGGEPLVIFPEGTRQTGPLVMPLFEGAAFVASRTGVPIIPVGIGGSERAMPKGAKYLRPVKVHLVVGAPIPAPVAPEGTARVPRTAVHAATERLAGDLQVLFDRAQARVGR